MVANTIQYKLHKNIEICCIFHIEVNQIISKKDSFLITTLFFFSKQQKVEEQIYQTIST